MSDWKTLGYVPDSDDEESDYVHSVPTRRDEAVAVGNRENEAAIVSTDHTVYSPTVVWSQPRTSQSSTVDKLKRLLDDGLQLIRDVRAISPVGGGTELSEDGSPLSSPPASIASSPRTSATVPNDVDLTTNLSHPLNSDVGGNEAQSGSRRSLRTRAPIQEHPYMLEDAKYRQLMTDRGLKPVNLPNVSRSEETQQAAEESQQTEDFENSQQEESLLSNMYINPIAVESGHRTTEIRDGNAHDLVMSGNDAEDDLPDLSQLFNQPSSIVRRKTKILYKRRLLSTQHQQQPQTQPDIYDLPDEDFSTRGNGIQNSEFRVPPSPPGSNDHLSTDDDHNDARPLLRTTKTGTPAALPTPLISSDGGTRKRPVMVVSSPETSSSSEAEDAQSRRSSQSAENDSQGLQWIRQRLRGVLPPSFISLDLEKRRRPLSKPQRLHAPMMSSNDRGIAQRTHASSLNATRAKATGESQLGEAESSDSEDARADAPSHEVKSAYMATRNVFSVDDSDEELTTPHVHEADEIDPMLPSTGSRQRKAHDKPKRQRQQRLDNGWAVKHQRSAADAVSAGIRSAGIPKVRLQKKRSLTTKRKKTKHKHRTLQMSVLDAPDLHDVTRDAQPQFLRLAARQVQRSSGSLSHRPPVKFFVLATEDDTRDVNEQLNRWKAERGNNRGGPVAADTRVFTTTQGSPAASKSTLPDKLTRFTSARDLDKLKRSTSLLLSRASNRENNATDSDLGFTIEEALDPTSKPDLDLQIGHLRSLFPHNNRSGQGRLLSRVPQPRPAQVEGDEVTYQPVSTLAIRTVRKVVHKASSTPAKFDKISQPQTPNNQVLAMANRRRPRKQKQPKPRQIPVPPSTTATGQESHLVSSGAVNLGVSAGVLVQKSTTNILTDVESKEWIGKTIESIQILRPLPPGISFYTLDTHNGSPLANLKRLSCQQHINPFQPTQVRVRITAPVYGTTMICGQYNEEVRMLIATILDEVFAMVCNPPTEGDYSADSYKGFSAAVAAVVHYFLGAVSFPVNSAMTVPQYLLDLSKTLTLTAEKFLSLSIEHYFLASRQKKRMLLQSLNSLTMLTTWLHLVIERTGLGPEFAMHKLSQRLIQRTFQLVFEPHWLWRAFHQLQNTDNDELSDTVNARVPFCQIVSIVIAWHICPMLTANSSRKMFFDVLRLSLAEAGVHKWSSPVEQLGLTSMALCLILQLSQITPAGESVEIADHPGNLDDSCYTILIGHLQNLTTQYPSGHASGSQSAIIGQLLESVEDLCLKMAKDWYHAPPPAIVTTLLRVYAWNSMLPFNTSPDDASVFGDLYSSSLNATCHANNDFSKLLELTEQCIYGLGGSATIRPESVVAPGKLRGFVFSMIPNNAQLIDARDELLSAQFLALKNHFNLYISLFTRVSEGFQPRIQQLEQQVDFSTSHHRVCQLAMAIWQTVALNYVQRDFGVDILEGMGHWMNTMLCQSIACFEIHGQFNAIALLEELLTSFATTLAHCVFEVKARALLNGETFETVTRLLNKAELHRNNDRVIIAGLKLLHAYARTTLSDHIDQTLLFRAQLVLKNLIQEVLSNPRVQNAELIRYLMSAWFATAHAMVRVFHKHWNDFVEPSSNLSIDFLSGLRNNNTTYAAKSCFFTDLIQTDPSFFNLECRPVVFMTWIATLLLPVQSMRFEHVLTNTILEKEHDSLMIQDLAAVLFNYGETRELTLQDVADSRIVILRHIIQNIYGQQDDPEEEWLAGGLDTASQKKLLMIIQKTMKAVWLDLKKDPVAQSDYTLLVHAILNEMEIYPVTGFKIDSWFYDYEFPRPKQSLDSIFKCRFGESAEAVNKDAVHNFCQQYTRALEEEKHDIFLEDMIRSFHCTDPIRMMIKDGRTQYSVDFAKQAKFIQIIFPAFLECGAQHTQSLIFLPILSLVTEMTTRLPYRIDNLEGGNIGPFMAMTAANLCALRNFFEETKFLHHATVPLLRYVRLCLACVFSLAEYGIEMEQAIFDMCMGNILALYVDIRYRLQAKLRAAPRTPLLPPHTVPIDDDEVDIPENDVVVIRDNTVLASWEEGGRDEVPTENFDLIDGKNVWMLCADAEEPELTEEEKGLRGFAAAELRPWREFLGVEGGVVEVEAWEEMVGLVRELKGRKLVAREGDGEEDEW